MKIIALGSALAFVAFTGVTAAFAADGATTTAKPSHVAAKPAAAGALICPVTKDPIASVKDAAGSSVYKGKTYYFCCAGCKPSFDKNPAKFVKEAVKPAPKSAAPTAKATSAAKA